ncbi:MAG: hypothetical protein R3F61_36185 [Myxococcota bacterium]
MTLARQWRGQRPFEEAWFVEALLGPDLGLWVRYVLDATAGEASVWALVMDRGGLVAAHKEVVPIESISGELFAGAGGRLEREHCVGRAGAIAWDLRLDDRGLRHNHIPFWARFLGVGRTYSPAVLDLRVQGTVSVGDRTYTVKSGPGVLGHLWGTRSRLQSWAWAHCNAFDREDLVFEGLCAYPGGYGPLTSLVLHADGHAYRFSRTRDLLRTYSRFSTDRWTWVFEAHRDGRVLTGEIALDPTRSATVRYPGHGRPTMFCTNSRFASARILLRDPRRGLDLDLRSRECAFEIVTPEDPGPTDL